jgi:hypothetical protein
MGTLNKDTALDRPYSRFHFEFWFICLIVSLGFTQSYPIGFYRFRLVDLVLILSFLYGSRMMIRGQFERKARLLLVVYLVSILIRTIIEAEGSFGVEFLRTLLGMSATYLAVFVFFVVRECKVSQRILVVLLVLAWVVALVSQLGLTDVGEGAAGGQVDLASMIGIERKEGMQFSIDYQESTIAVWRALSVGATFGLLLAKTELSLKLVGVVALILQFSGGGGGRSILLFVFFVPFILFLLQGSIRRSQRLRKLFWVGPLALGLAGIYLWSPIGGRGPVKGAYEETHFERATEIFTLFTGGWSGATNIGGFEGRTIGYEEYWQAIVANPSIFFFGAGLSKGAAFDWTALGLAHNFILDVWGLTGLVGLTFFVIFLWYVVSDLWRLLRVSPNGTVGQIIAFSYATTIIYMFQWLLFQAVTADRSFMIVFYMAAGLLRPTTRWLVEQSIRNSRGGGDQ